MKHLLLPFLALFFAGNGLYATEKSSWWQNFCVFFGKYSIAKPIITNDPLAHEVKSIVKQGLTVKEVETRKLRNQQKMALQHLKECAQVSDEKWNQITKELDKPNSLIKKHELDNKNLQIQIYSLSEKLRIIPNENIYERHKIIEEIVKIKLKKYKLDDQKIDIYFEKDFKEKYDSPAGASYQRDKAWIRLDYDTISHYSYDHLDAIIDHEIVHIKKNHALTRTLIREINPNNIPMCLAYHRHLNEYEADNYFALRDIATARNLRSFLCDVSDAQWPFHNWGTDTHPAPYHRCQEAAKIVTMLELEQKIKPYYQSKQEYRAQIQSARERMLKAFDPALNG